MNKLWIVISFCFLLLSARTTTAANIIQIPLFKEYRCVVRVGNPKLSLARNIPIIFKDKLQINASLSYRTASRKNEISGIKDLKRLCNNAFLEEWWGFFPDEQLWVEMGHDEKIDSTGIDFNYLKDIIKKKDQIRIYHIHLKTYLKSMEHQGYGKMPETWLIVPSFEDIALMVYFSDLFYKYHPRGDIAWYICSPLGVTEYHLSDTGIDYFSQIKQDSFFLEYLCPCRANVMSPEPLSTFDISAPHKADDLIEWANVQGKGYLEIKFFPYNTPTISTLSLGPGQ